MNTPILITGAGCTGLVLALCLLKQGVTVRIIDKASSLRAGERGAGILPRSLELHDYLGTYNEIVQYASTIIIRRYYGPDGRTPVRDDPMLTPVEPTPSIPHPYAVLLGQDHQEHILRTHVERLGGTIEFNTELRSFEQVDSKVIAHLVSVSASGAETEETAEFQYLVGADGARSAVRKHLDAQFLGETKDDGFTLVVGDIFVESGLDPEVNDPTITETERRTQIWHSWGSPPKSMFILRRTGRVPKQYSINCAGSDVDTAKVSESREAFIEAFYKASKREDIKFGNLIWISRYRPNIRMVDSFKFGRVFLAGDAAHCHSPTGGQGMNSSIQDSFNLAWKLALVTKGHAPPSLLDTYNEERLPVIAEMLNITTNILHKVFSSKEGQNTAHWQRGGDLNQLGVNYRHSSIVVEQRSTNQSEGGSTVYHIDEKEVLRAGDRAPDATGLIVLASPSQIPQQPTSDRLHKTFDITRHTLLFFYSKLDDGLNDYLSLIARLEKHNELFTKVLVLPSGFNAAGSVVEEIPYDLIVKDGEGHAYKIYGAASEGADRTDATVVVVRPDAVVGAVVRDVVGLKAYFDKIFTV